MSVIIIQQTPTGLEFLSVEYCANASFQLFYKFLMLFQI